MLVAGIDVAAKTLAVLIQREDTNAKVQEFANTPSGHQALLKRLRQARVQRVCLEATGTYHLDLALALEGGGVAVMVVNPKAAKRFAEALLTRTKTDAVDAAVLAEFAQRMPFEPWQPPAPVTLELRAYARRLSALTHARTQTKNQLHALQQSTTTPAVLLEELHLAIAETDARIERLRTAALALIETAAQLK
ncbi:IS110 family transposase, partial [Thiorhodococcus minor]